MRKFGSLAAIREADAAAIAEVDGIGEKTAEMIKKALSK